VLGRGLQRAGFRVLLAAPQNFAAFIQDQGLDFHPLRGDVQQIMASKTGRNFMQTGSANPIRSIRAMRAMLGPVALQMAEDALEACREADALISLAVFAPLAKSIAELREFPLIHVEPTPVLPTRSFPAPGWPLQKDLGGLHNRLSGFAMLQVIWQWYRPFVNQFRRRFGLPPYSGSSFHRILSSTPLLGAYSPTVIPPPPDWPASAHITGYWFSDAPASWSLSASADWSPSAPADWSPSAELEAFLAAGEPPVYIGFGSMAGRSPQRFTDLVLQALAKSGRRGLLLTGWGGLQDRPVPAGVFVLDSAPHGWLFPRMAAVVHHGGAGTTAEGLRAGVPSVILPFIVDQNFWGRRVRALGVGPSPIPGSKLTAERLAGAIREAVTQPEIAVRAAALGEAIRREDGLGRAVEIVQQVLGV
jgi:UDP:flavonoid glycosyltransferase YjiC (YdhE family)